MLHHRMLGCGLSLLLLSVLHAGAASIKPVSLPPVTHNPASLTVVGKGGARTYTPAELEAMGTYQLVTTTPWREQPAVFDGALLADILAENGLEGAAALRFIAENKFEVVMERAVWTAGPILIATRVDGAPHTRRARGPLQVVMPMDLYTATEAIGERHWVWMVARIEPVE